MPVRAPLRGIDASAVVPAQPDVLLVTIDTLRHDFLSCYGFPRATTPAIDALAADGTLFEEHRTVMSLTLPAHTTLFSGLFPAEHGVRRNSHQVTQPVPLLAERFQRAGYRTAAFVGSTVLAKKRGLARGFELYDDQMPTTRKVGATRVDFERDATAVTASALEALRSDDPRPLLLWMHLFDPHEPYLAPPEHLEQAAHSQAIHAAAVEPTEFFSAAQQLRQRTGYEAEVRHVDACLAQFLAAWDARERGRAALVVLTSDHGQGLGEHDYGGHGFRIYEEQLRVPLVVRMPGRVPRGLRVGAQTSAVDLAATVADLARLEERDVFGGSSLADLFAAPERERGPSFAERREWRDADVARVGEVSKLLERLQGRAGATQSDQFALVDGRWKYIWSEGAGHEVFDLRADPRELENLLLASPQEAQALRARLEAWHAATSSRVGEQLEPEVDAETLNALKALGY